MKRFALAFALSLCAAGGSRAQEPERSVVAVLRFDNNTGDERYDHLGRAMSSMMISDLSAIERIQLVERERMEEVMAEQNLQYSGRVDPETAVTLGMIVGADYMVFGSFVTVDPEMRLDTRVTRTETAEIVTTADVRGQGESLFDLQQQLADTLIAGLQLVLTEEERARLRAQQEANRIDDVETAIAFSEALCLADNGAYPEAFEAMQRVQAAAPRSQIVGATVELLRRRAADDARDRVTDGVRRGIGGLIGRDLPRAQPSRQRPAAC
ncbi:MAG: CsgG/HfaB family protein [Gemmatimonadales bacterium]